MVVFEFMPSSSQRFSELARNLHRFPTFRAGILCARAIVSRVFQCIPSKAAACSRSSNGSNAVARAAVPSALGREDRGCSVMTDAAGSPALASFDIRETSLCKSCTLCGIVSNNFSDFHDNCSGHLKARLQPSIVQPGNSPTTDLSVRKLSMSEWPCHRRLRAARRVWGALILPFLAFPASEEAPMRQRRTGCHLTEADQHKSAQANQPARVQVRPAKSRRLAH